MRWSLPVIALASVLGCKQGSQEAPKEAPQEAPNEAPKEAPKEAAKEAPTAAPDVGSAAPDFSLPGSDGKTYRLSDFRGKKPVVLAWFKKAFTGG
jgi:AhpC/TSA family